MESPHKNNETSQGLEQLVTDISVDHLKTNKERTKLQNTKEPIDNYSCSVEQNEQSTVTKEQKKKLNVDKNLLTNESKKEYRGKHGCENPNRAKHNTNQRGYNKSDMGRERINNKNTRSSKPYGEKKGQPSNHDFKKNNCDYQIPPPKDYPNENCDYGMENSYKLNDDITTTKSGSQGTSASYRNNYCISAPEPANDLAPKISDRSTLNPDASPFCRLGQEQKCETYSVNSAVDIISSSHWEAHRKETKATTYCTQDNVNNLSTTMKKTGAITKRENVSMSKLTHKQEKRGKDHSPSTVFHHKQHSKTEKHQKSTREYGNSYSGAVISCGSSLSNSQSESQNCSIDAKVNRNNNKRLQPPSSSKSEPHYIKLENRSWREDNKNSSNRNRETKDESLGYELQNKIRKIFDPLKDDELIEFVSYVKSPKAGHFVKVTEEDKDLFTVGEDYSLAHCVAEDMNMGSGIAVEFRRKFKSVPELLSKREKSGGLAVLEDNGRYIYYMVTKKISSGKPTYDSFSKSLKKLRDHVKENDVKKLAMPTIGCGLDRLDWKVVKILVEFLFSELDVSILVCNFQQNYGQTKSKLEQKKKKDVRTGKNKDKRDKKKKH